MEEECSFLVRYGHYSCPRVAFTNLPVATKEGKVYNSMSIVLNNIIDQLVVITQYTG